MRDKDSESRMHSKRIRPYETEDLPFGENLEHLSFQEEECKYFIDMLFFKVFPLIETATRLFLWS